MAGPITVYTRGPLFAPGRSAEVIDRFLDAAKDDVAQEGYQLVHDRLSVFKHPTGRYAGRVMIERAARDRVITDQGIVYGPWLEGTSSRNQSTRFKGYRIFRRVAQQLRRQVRPIAQRQLDAFLARLR